MTARAASTSGVAQVSDLCPAPRRSRRRGATGWTTLQQRTAVMASSAAGWDDAHRYIALRSSGCPDLDDDRRPSVKHPRNSQRSFERYMALAESCAAALGGKRIRRPAEHKSWADAAAAETDRAIALAIAMATEACARCPGQFKDPSRIVSGIVERITRRDAESPEGVAVHGGFVHDDIRACNPSQVRRVVEALRAWLGRVMVECGAPPTSFTVPPSAVARAKRSDSGSGSGSGGGTGLRPVSSPTSPTTTDEAPF